MNHRVVLGVVAACGLALLLLATWPQVLGLQRTVVIAQLTALRGLLVLVAVAAALIAGFVALRARPLRAFGGLIAAAFLAVAAINVAVISSRGLGGPPTEAAGPGSLKVLAWNVLKDAPGADPIAHFALELGVDVIAIPEVSRAMAEEVARLMGEGGRPVQVFSLSFHETNLARSTALLVSSSLGEYELDESVGSTERAPTVVARPRSGAGPTLLAAHPVPPVPGSMRAWESGLRWLAARCREGEVIVAGDLNATLEHFAGLYEPGADLGACRDAARAMGSAALGTWPSRLPPLIGSPIDHVMATGEWEFVDFRVVTELDGLGSDHRAVLATLRRGP